MSEETVENQPGPGLDLGALLGAAQQMQEQMHSAQQEMAETTFQGVAGGGMVSVAVTGGMVFQRVSIDPAVVDPADVAMLEDLVLAALTDAAARVNEAQQASVAGALPPGLGGALGGLLGG